MNTICSNWGNLNTTCTENSPHANVFSFTQLDSCSCTHTNHSCWNGHIYRNIFTFWCQFWSQSIISVIRMQHVPKAVHKYCNYTSVANFMNLTLTLIHLKAECSSGKPKEGEGKKRKTMKILLDKLLQQ